jgi:hypothetical protein
MSVPGISAPEVTDKYIPVARHFDVRIWNKMTKQVARRHGVPYATFLSSRIPRIAQLRAALMWVVRDIFEVSLSGIARWAGRHHTSVLQAVKKSKEATKNNDPAYYKARVSVLQICTELGYVTTWEYERERAQAAYINKGSDGYEQLQFTELLNNGKPTLTPEPQQPQLPLH